MDINSFYILSHISYTRLILVFFKVRKREMGMAQLVLLNKAKPYLLMVLLQCGAAGMYLISSVILKQGMSRYVLIVYRNAIAALVIAPFALVLERKIRPKMTVSVFFQITALAILE